METTETPPRIPRPATDDPEQVKALMIAALASNACMGIVQAAIGLLADPEQRPDDAELWEVSRATHEKWLESDPKYAETVAFLEKVGLKAQREGHWMAGLSLMSDDAAIWKAMLPVFAAKEKATDATKTSSPFEGKSTEELQALLENRKIKIVGA